MKTKRQSLQPTLFEQNMKDVNFRKVFIMTYKQFKKKVAHQVEWEDTHCDKVQLLTKSGIKLIDNKRKVIVYCGNEECRGSKTITMSQVRKNGITKKELYCPVCGEYRLFAK